METSQFGPPSAFTANESLILKKTFFGFYSSTSKNKALNANFGPLTFLNIENYSENYSENYLKIILITPSIKNK